ncbi:MAG TPA: lysylphosphatidylglycerol synthase transmembrane domain-containing protein [Candidatus Limnocylindrales bacterium]|nr:lysylphosphatidylglycerol synthase transmembrane domain-containing protein [Candidatus Limnocylindrales bacterium]
MTEPTGFGVPRDPEPPGDPEPPDDATPDVAGRAERRSGLDRRLSIRRQTPGQPQEERRSGLDRRVPDERREADRINADALSLGRRLRQPKTILSLVLPIIFLVLIFRVVLNVNVGELIAGVRQANPLLLLAAFVIFYAGFPLRGFRWALLLRGTGFRIGLRDATEILFLSWLVNCLVPAKLGDVYRAYLLKLNSPVSLSRTFGTVFIERILDLFAISVLGLAAGFWSFRNGLPTQIQVVFGIAVGVVIVLAVGLLTLRNFGRQILVRLPVPHRVVEFYDRFEEGVFGAVGLRHLPPLVVLTGLIWATEAMRLYLVVAALGFPDVELGISGAFFVALIGSLLTAVPFSPAGLGIVELGVVGILTAVYGVSGNEATTIALVDRTISVLSIIVLGSIAYSISSKRRGAGLTDRPVPGLSPPAA